MAYRKTAITVPADVLAAIDKDAKRLGESRSKYIVRLLRAVMRARTDAEIKRRLDAFFADPKNVEAQRREAEEWLQVSTAGAWPPDEDW